MTRSNKSRLLFRSGVVAVAVSVAMSAGSVAMPAPSQSASPAPQAAPSVVPTATLRQESSRLRTPPAAGATSPVEVPIDAQTAEFRAELARRQALLDEFLAQLEVLDRELSIAAEAHNAATARLEATQREVAQSEVDLANAEAALAVQNETLSDRAAAIYREGTYTAVEVLLGSESLGDLIKRVRFLNDVGAADAEIAATLRAQRDFVRQKAEELRVAEQQAVSLEFELTARQLEVMMRIQDRQAMLANAQTELLDLLDEHASQRQAEEAALLRSIISGANRAGIQVVPGTPVETAFAYYGVPYLWGGKTPAAFDCSGLMRYVFLQHGVTLPHYSGAQFRVGERIVPSALQPGDAVFFGSPIHHVGMYVGGGYFIHAPRTGDFVSLDSLASRRDYAGARRYNWVPRTSPPSGARVNVGNPLTSID